MTVTVGESPTPVSESHPDYPDEVHKFESPEDFADWFRQNPLPLDAAREKFGDAYDYWLSELPSNAEYPSTLMRGRDKFNCTGSFDKALEYLRLGWREGAEKMLSYKGEVKRVFNRTVELPHFVMGQEGSDIEMQRFMNGEPEHMIGYATTDTDKASPIITVDTNLSCAFCEMRACDHTPVNPDWHMMRGAVLFLMIQLMRQAGLYPEVWVGTVSFHNEETETKLLTHNMLPLYRKGSPFPLARPIKPKKRSVLVRVLAPDSLLDPGKLAFLLSHDALVRRLEFRMEEVLSFREAGAPFPIESSAKYIGTDGFYRNNSRPHAGMLLGTRQDGFRYWRDSPRNQPAFDRVLERGHERQHIHFPSYTSLDQALQYLTGSRSHFVPEHIREQNAWRKEQALRAIGDMNKPATAAAYLLGLMNEAGIHLEV